MAAKNVTLDASTLKQLLSRIDRIEKAIFSNPGKAFSIQKKQEFSGPAGGIRLLISRGFFKSKKYVREVRGALTKNGYHYGGSQIQTAMNRFSKRNGPLVASKVSGNKTYVDRK